MIRWLAILVGICCLAIVLLESAAVGWYWSKGRLSQEKLREMGDILSGKSQEVVVEEPEEKEEPEVSLEEVTRQRVLRLFDIGRREDELQILRDLVAEHSGRVTAMQAELERKQKDFQKNLDQLKAANDEAAVQQARAILQAQQPAEAADTLMALEPERALIVLRGMPEKVIARILKELSRGDDKRIERGQKLFEAISGGDPARSLFSPPSPAESRSASAAN